MKKIKENIYYLLTYLFKAFDVSEVIITRL